jgi:hypothetical protein
LDVTNLSREKITEIIKMGCTFRHWKFRSMEQNYKQWNTCRDWDGNPVIVCLCWAIYCHRDHEIDKKNIPIRKEVWAWGEMEFIREAMGKEYKKSLKTKIPACKILVDTSENAVEMVIFWITC